MSQAPTLRTCPDCRARNPERLTVCYACGQSLIKRREGEPRSGEQTYPCLNCGAQIGFSAQNCPACGRLAAPPAPTSSQSGLADAVERATLAPLPIDWEIEPLPDGTVRLQKTSWGKLFSDGNNVTAVFFLTILLAFVAIGFWSAFTGPRPRVSSNPVPVAILSSFLVLFVVAALLWVFCGRDELRVGPGFLERRRRLFRWESVKRISGGAGNAIFNGSTERIRGDSRSGPQTIRTLRVESLRGRWILEQRSYRDNDSLLTSLAEPNDPVTQLGKYLAAQTGWPFYDSGTPR
jgi:ribosomal protein L40E